MRNSTHAFSLGTMILLPCCGSRGEPAPPNPPPNGTSVARVADTMVLSAPGGTTVWLGPGREARDSGGTSCTERTIEIRRGSSRISIPLLYTLSPPTLLNDSTLRAELARDCRTTAAYRVSLRTGQPVRIP